MLTILVIYSNNHLMRISFNISLAFVFFLNVVLICVSEIPHPHYDILKSGAGVSAISSASKSPLTSACQPLSSYSQDFVEKWTFSQKRL